MAITNEELHSTIIEIKGMITPISQDVTLIKTLVTGNGTPERGLVVQTQKNTSFRHSARKLFWLIGGGIISMYFTWIAIILFGK